MILVKSLDLDWFWLGYICGANSRKRLEESPSSIQNLGKQGVQKQPNEKQKVSFFIGIIHGRHKIVQNLDIVKVIQYQDKKRRGKGQYLTFGMCEVKGEKGHIVNMPVSISNNSVENRGYIGFQAKIKYPTSTLTLNNITQSNPLITSFQYQHDAVNGIVLIQGMMDNVSYEDKVQFYLSFLVSGDAVGTQIISMCGASGTGQNSDVLTRINNEIYYIQPLTLEDGKILLENEQGVQPSYSFYSETIPSIGSNYDFYGGNSGGSGGAALSYDFELGLTYGGSRSGSGGGGSGARLAVLVTFGDGSSEKVYIPVEEGTHKYTGKIPLDLPSRKKGPVKITIELEQEDEDDLYYWFIKAGALWGLDTIIPREEVGEYEDAVADKPRVSFGKLRLYDGYELVFEGFTPIITDWVMGDSLGIIDDKIIQFISSFDVSDIVMSDFIELLSDYLLEIEKQQGEENLNLIGDGYILDFE